MNRNFIGCAVISLALSFTSCTRQECSITIEGGNIPVAKIDSKEGASKIREIIKRGRHAVDSIKSPLLGYASSTLTVAPPESPLMNFAADALFSEAKEHTGENIDIAITNKGGLRSELPEGEITFGDIYNVFPFENTLVTLTLNGEQLLSLLNEIAKAGGEPICGAKMSIIHSEHGDIAGNIKIGNNDLNLKKEYRIATSDYLSQGNDGLQTLAEGYNRKLFNITIRELMVNYVKKLHRKGKTVNAVVDGRIKKVQ